MFFHQNCKNGHGALVGLTHVKGTSVEKIFLCFAESLHAGEHTSDTREWCLFDDAISERPCPRAAHLPRGTLTRAHDTEYTDTRGHLSALAIVSSFCKVRKKVGC